MSKPVWVDEVVGCVDNRGRILCRTCAAEECIADAFVYVDSTYSDCACERCGTIPNTLARRWAPPHFPDACRGTRPPDPGFVLQA